MKETVYITGHKHPDTDAIVATLSYAHLKNKLGDVNAIPIRVGHLSEETKFVLDYFGVDAPIYKASMKTKVKDLDIDKAYTLTGSVSIGQAWNIIQDNKLNSLPISDESGKLVGIVSLSNLTSSYMDIWDDKIIGRANTPTENIIDVLNADYLVKPKNPREKTGKISVFANDVKSDKNLELVSANDLVVVGDRYDAQDFCINQKVAVMVLSNGSKLTDDLLKKAYENDVTVLTTQYDSFMTSRLLPTTIPVEHVMSRENLVTFSPEDNIEDVAKKMAENRFRSYPVVDESGRVVGNISRYHLISAEKKKLILVDHNEKNQSIDDIDDAQIVEIIDHHRVANISTTGPVYFRNEPVGSSNTIISEMFFEKGIRPSREIAGIICAAIISDTLFFKSPTSTATDEKMVSRMSRIAGIDPEKFALEMFKAGTSLKNKRPEDLIDGDVKVFPIAGDKIRIGQIMTMDMERLESIKDELSKHMEEKIELKGENTFVLVLTDIFNETSKFLVVGQHRDSIANAFNATYVNDTFEAKGVLSRKKQVLPKITEAVARDNF
ncbi:MAG: putative manganese-dependent inorganic diphosphatase [Peptoniphilaceae bacterium]|nr:putative manganese-dependent inorganic diphosphatase [Peptoniphilaceae bacterium]MDD7383080.1 putative manganese-dependent inorganic diphosphatase [Peptoniphilaceae bacterium]MDY3737515.1 putative manganese-dependent inorganic diphosphatase [Peptoniphilaceae bacterium]